MDLFWFGSQLIAWFDKFWKKLKIIQKSVYCLISLLMFCLLSVLGIFFCYFQSWKRFFDWWKCGFINHQLLYWLHFKIRFFLLMYKFGVVFPYSALVIFFRNLIWLLFFRAEIVESASFLDEWSQWSTCSRSCGGGLRTRYQQCIVVATAQYVSHPDESVTEDVDIPKPRAVPRRQCSKDDPLDGIEVECCAAHFCPGTAVFLVYPSFCKWIEFQTVSTNFSIYFRGRDGGGSALFWGGALSRYVLCIFVWLIDWLMTRSFVFNFKNKIEKGKKAFWSMVLCEIWNVKLFHGVVRWWIQVVHSQCNTAYFVLNMLFFPLNC